MNKIAQVIGVVLFGIIVFSSSMFQTLVYSQNQKGGQNSISLAPTLPTIKDRNLKVEPLATLLHPTTMAVLSSDDILVLQKEGAVRRIINGKLLEAPLLKVNAGTQNESGMLGIAVSNHPIPYVFIFYTELGIDGKNNNCPSIKNCRGETGLLANRLYRYELNDNKLINPKLILDLPAATNSEHIGGAVTVGPDDNLYLISGDGDTCKYKSCYKNRYAFFWSKTSNVQYGLSPDGRGGILRITQEGKEVKEPILSKNFPLNLYYAYGIRNGFGIDFDPITGKLWDTENGPGFGDEINLVEPGFNSGWNKVQGIWRVFNYDPETKEHGWAFFDSDLNGMPEDLVNFKGKGKYSPPEFIWNNTVGPTAIKFLNSDKLGKKYENDMFVGDVHNGNIYHFDLNDNRTELELKGPLEDKIVNYPNETEGVIFGKGFGTITDIEEGPDGCMYVASIWTNMIFRICHK